MDYCNILQKDQGLFLKESKFAGQVKSNLTSAIKRKIIPVAVDNLDLTPRTC
jgi:hypothetical protein